jgi:hypothetical protein
VQLVHAIEDIKVVDIGEAFSNRWRFVEDEERGVDSRILKTAG